MRASRTLSLLGRPGQRTTKRFDEVCDKVWDEVYRERRVCDQVSSPDHDTSSLSSSHTLSSTFRRVTSSETQGASLSKTRRSPLGEGGLAAVHCNPLPRHAARLR